jgi:hypothetical protein
LSTHPKNSIAKIRKHTCPSGISTNIYPTLHFADFLAFSSKMSSSSATI